MTAQVETPVRPDRQLPAGVAWRAAVIVVAVVAVLLEAPAWLRTPLSVAAAVVTVAFVLQRCRRSGVLHTVLAAVGGGVVVLALLGLVLNLLPAGLTTVGWAIAVGVIELVLLVAVAALRPDAAPLSRLRRPSIAAIGWSAAVAGALALAIGWSAASFTGTHLAPLALEARQVTGATVLTVTSGTEQGPYRLDLVTGSGRRTLIGSVRVGPERTATTTLRLPAGTRGLVQLVSAGGSDPVRELILATTTSKDAG